jgi:hypothetical protein
MAFSSEVKDWRLFFIADARAPFRPTLAAESLVAGKREPSRP